MIILQKERETKEAETKRRRELYMNGPCHTQRKVQALWCYYFHLLQPPGHPLGHPTRKVGIQSIYEVET